MREANGVESKIAVLRTDVDSLISEFHTFAKDVRDALTSSRQTNWGTIISACGLVVTLIGAIGFAIIEPMKVAQQKDTEISNLNVQIVRLELTEKTNEIETQFRGMDNTRNAQYIGQLRVTALLWQKVYGQEYPSFEYSPSISK